MWIVIVSYFVTLVSDSCVLAACICDKMVSIVMPSALYHQVHSSAFAHFVIYCFKKTLLIESATCIFLLLSGKVYAHIRINPYAIFMSAFSIKGR